MIEKKAYDFKSAVTDFILDVKYERLSGTNNVTMGTLRLLKEAVGKAEWNTAFDLIRLIKEEGKVMGEGLKAHPAVGNLVRRVLKIIREEYVALLKNRQEEAEESLHKIVTGDGEGDNYRAPLPLLRPAIIDHINEFHTELESTGENIAQQAKEHIHSNEIIMTLGRSEAVEAFLKRAALDRQFEVIVVGCEPDNRGHEMAARLAKVKIQTTVIPDSAVFGIMSRVNKVIMGVDSVMANGGLRAVSGSHGAALAARHHSVPVLVLAPLHHLSPLYVCSSQDQGAFNRFASPQGVLPYFHHGEEAIHSKAHLYSPAFDYVPPDLVTLFISNQGGHSPSYVYRLLTELYHPDDYEL